MIINNSLSSCISSQFVIVDKLINIESVPSSPIVEFRLLSD